MTVRSEKSEVFVEVDGRPHRVTLTTSANNETQEWRAAVDLDPPTDNLGFFLREMAGSVNTPPGTWLEGMTMRGRFQ